MLRTLTIALALTLSACAATPPAHPEASPFANVSVPMTNVDAALTRAAAADKRVILIFGSNACHDSRGLAGWFDTARFQAMLQPRYEIVWVDVGFAKDGSPEIARRFGLEPISGTPTVLIVGPDGTPLNLADAPSWRNAWTRDADDIYAYFEKWGPPIG